jgi:hypothetical protein
LIEKQPLSAKKELTMKKGLIGLILVLVLVVVSPSTFAANPIQLVIDGVVVKANTSPEIKNNRMMVPLRVISENLGAQVYWSGSSATLTKKNLNVTVTPNNSKVVINGNSLEINVKPYIKNNLMFVPLRFIAEAFGSTVGYQNNIVTVDAVAFRINGVNVNILQQEYHMINEEVVQHILGSAYIETIFNLIISSRGAVVEEPASYSWMYNIDVPGSYAEVGQYEFLDKNGNTVKRFDIYTLVNKSSAEKLGYAKDLVYDATENKWYLLSETTNYSILNVINTANNNGFTKAIIR